MSGPEHQQSRICGRVAPAEYAAIKKNTKHNIVLLKFLMLEQGEELSKAWHTVAVSGIRRIASGDVTRPGLVGKRRQQFRLLIVRMPQLISAFPHFPGLSVSGGIPQRASMLPSLTDL